MPARRRTAVAAGTSIASIASPASPQEDDEAYKLKRKRNNDAVKKTRQKSKQTAAERKNHVEQLKSENSKLESKIDAEKANIKFLKELLLNGVKEDQHERVIREILDEPTDDEEDDQPN